MENFETINWKDLLDRSREALNGLDDDDNNNDEAQEEIRGSSSRNSFLSLVSNFKNVSTLMHSYLTELSTGDKLNQADDDNDDENNYDDEPIELSRALKIMVVDTRRALRFVLSMLSDSHTRKEIQSCAVSTHALHEPLSCMISTRMADSKCRTLAAQIMCNLGTANGATAEIILHHVSASPSDSDTARMMLEKMSYAEEPCMGNAISQTCVAEERGHTSSWAQMIHSFGGIGDRITLAAVAAALHNAIASITGTDAAVDVETTVDIVDAAIDTDSHPWNRTCHTLSSDHMLVSNLVRYILPSGVIQPEKSDDDSPGRPQDLSDDATEWISRLLEKLCTLGMLPRLFASLGSQTKNIDIDGITPEQLVLLHCVANAVEEHEQSMATSTNTKDDHPLGGHFLAAKASFSTFQFLADQYGSFRRHLRRIDDANADKDANNDNDPDNDNDNDKDITSSGDTQERYSGEYACIENAANVILDILSSSLSVDTKSNGIDFACLRKSIGQTSDILPNILLDLGKLVDSLGIENRGVKARELKIKDSDQHLVTSIVRLIGNMCYRCKENQDLVRHTIVPIPRNSKDNVQEYTQLSKEEEARTGVRNGLHVLLSCTSFAYGCFTLREWAIVAIRNTLEDNPENQKQVEELEAQQALDTPELKKLGVKVDMDKNGKVHVSPQERL